FKPVNHGQTPAYELRHTFDFAVIVSENPRAVELPEPTRAVDTSFAVFPNGPDVMWFEGQTPMTAEDVQAIAAGNAYIHIWGRTRYRDAFGERRYVNFSAFL